MTDDSDALGGRLPLADPQALTPDQKKLFGRVVDQQLPWADDAGFTMRSPDGRLIGPFNGFLLRPDVSQAFLDFQAAVATSTSLDERLREVVIVSVGGAWGAAYEMYAHKILAQRAGISRAAIEAVAAGELPDELSEKEKLAALLARRLTTGVTVDDALYDEVERAFGRQGLYDIVALMGVYHTVSTLLTLFAVPAPE